MKPRLTLPISPRAEAEPFRSPWREAIVEANADGERRVECDRSVRFSINVVPHDEARLRGGRAGAPEVRHRGVLRRGPRLHEVRKNNELRC